jgi:hypothetical protein
MTQLKEIPIRVTPGVARGPRSGCTQVSIRRVSGRRDRAQRRLLQVLKALADVRRINRPVVQVSQVNVGDGNTNVLSV